MPGTARHAGRRPTTSLLDDKIATFWKAAAKRLRRKAVRSTPDVRGRANGEELIVLTRAAYESLVTAAEAAEPIDQDDEDAADVAMGVAAKAEWEAAGRPSIPLQVLRRVRAGDSYLKVFRNERGLTQTDLASLAGITQGYLSEIESSRKAPNEATREVLAKALDIHPVWLSEDAPRPSHRAGV